MRTRRHTRMFRFHFRGKTFLKPGRENPEFDPAVFRVSSGFVQQKRIQGQPFARSVFERTEAQAGKQRRITAFRRMPGLHGLSEPVDKLACDGRPGAFPCPQEESAVLRPCAAADFDCDTVEFRCCKVHGFGEFCKRNLSDAIEFFSSAEHFFRILHTEMGNFGIETRHFFRRIYHIAGDGAEALSGEQFFPSFRGRHAARAAFADERSIRENGVPELSGVGKLRVDMPVTVHRRRFHEFAGAVEIADQVRGDDDERGGITGFRAEFIPPASQTRSIWILASRTSESCHSSIAGFSSWKLSAGIQLHPFTKNSFLLTRKVQSPIV